MKKRKCIMKRCLSLMLSLVMAAGVFVGTGLESKAASKKVVLYKAGSGITFTDGSWIERDINMRIYDSNGQSEYIDWKAGSGATTNLADISRIEFLDSQYYSSDGIDPTEYYVHPEYNADGQFSIIVWPACKLNIKVVDHQNNPVPNQVVNIKWLGKDYGNVTTDSQGMATHWKVRTVAFVSDVKVSTQYDGRTHSLPLDSEARLGDTYSITFQIPKIRTVSVNLKNAGGELLKGARIGSGDITFSDNDNNGTYTADLEVGKSYDIGAYVQGYEYKTASTGIIRENTNSIDVIMDAELPSLSSSGPITVTVGDSYGIFRYNFFDGQGINYTSEVEDPTVASYNGSSVTGLKEGSTNLHFHAVTGNVKRTITVPITVNKSNPIIKITPPVSVVYGEDGGSFVFRSSTAGTFSINGKSIPVGADTDVTRNTSDILSGSPAAGSYNLSWTFTPTESDKYNVQNGTVNYTVGAKDFTDIGSLSFTEESFVYDGTAKNVKDIVVTVDGKKLNENTDYTVSYKDNVNAGTATVTVNGKGNYMGAISKNFTIEKATISVAGATAENRQYDGTETVAIKDVVLNNKASKDVITNVVDLSGANAKISDKKVGTYATVTHLTGIRLIDTNNYVLEEPKAEDSISLAGNEVSISPKEVIIENVVIEDSKIYDGDSLAVITDKGMLSANYDGDNLYIDEGKASYNNKNVGKDKPVTFSEFSVAGSASANYTLIRQPEPQLAEIKQKELRLEPESVIVESKYYDGTTKAEYKRVPALVESDIVMNDDVRLMENTVPEFDEAGSPDEEREIKVTTNLTLTGEDASNYCLQIPDVTAIIQNYTAEKNKDYTVNSNDWINQDFVIEASGECLLAESLDSEWVHNLTVACEDNKSSTGLKTFYVKYADGKISSAVSEAYKIDKIEPEGSVTFTEADSEWTKFIERITFGLFYKDAQEVIIHAADQDGLSDIASVEWYESLDKEMTREEVEQITAWKKYQGNLIVPLKDTKKFVYYVKIADKAGNITYLSTEGAVYDITKPAISGIINGETYYTTQTATVTDTNLKEVLFNEVSLDVSDGKADAVTLKGNVDKTYTISATDEAGNITTVMVEMVSVATLTEDVKNAIEAIENETDIPGNKELVEDAVNAKLAYDSLNDAEKAAIGEDGLRQIEESYKKATDYQIIKGADGVYKRGSSRVLSFTANGAFDHFKEVRVDDEKVSDENYMAKAGSTIVEFKPAYLKTLKIGQHTLKVVYDVLGQEYIAECEFTVKKRSSEPAEVLNASGGGSDTNVTTAVDSAHTGDQTNVFGWMCTLIVSAAAIIFVAAGKKRSTEK